MISSREESVWALAELKNNSQFEGMREMADRDLGDDMLKLVRYKVLFVKREYEHAFREHEALVSENVDESVFILSKITEFMQELGRGETPVPRQWQERGYPLGALVRDGRLIGLPDEDKKHLRVSYEVLGRYPRERLKYDENKMRILERIADAIQEKTGAQAKPKGNA